MEKENNFEKICIDTQILTLSILNDNFKNILKDNIMGDYPFTTILCKNESIGNLMHILNINWKEASKKFESLKTELKLDIIDYRQEHLQKGKELYEKVLNSNLFIKNKKTLLVDCVNLFVILENKIKIYFSNDEDLSKICRTFHINLDFVRISDSTNKTIKDAFDKPKFQYLKKGQKAKK